MNYSYMSVCVCVCVYVYPFITRWTVAHPDPLAMGFSRQKYWSGLPFRPPGNLPNPGMEPTCLASPALAGRFLTTEPPGKFYQYIYLYMCILKLEQVRDECRQRT